MYDLVIRGGLVVDGSGAAGRITDVAVSAGRIAAVGDGPGRGHREIDAAGLLVTPGFVDIHTHYDGQATWDATLTPSSWHGVTTAVCGNCGVGFAPVRPGASPYLIQLMEGVEDIPGTALAEGVPFNWESFPDYLDALEAMPRTMDLGTQVPHAALRFFVMGDRGADHAEVPTADEIERMGVLLEQALKAGALGFTTSRTIKHRARDGRPTPSLSAREPELFGLAAAMRRAGTGVLEVNSDFGPGEFEVMREAARAAGRPLSCLLVQVDNAPGLWRQTLNGIHAARAEGLAVNAQVGCRPIGVLMGIDTTVNPFTTHPRWIELAAIPAAERVRRLRTDDALRLSLITQHPDDEYTTRIATLFGRLFALTDDLDYEPSPDKSLLERARRSGRSPWEEALEVMLTHDGQGLIMHTFENYSHGTLEDIRAMLADEATVMGIADAGAHVATVCDAASPTYLLSYWHRDRQGERFPLEFLVRKQTRDTALAYGLGDRGLLAPGLRADINVIDYDRLGLERPHLVYDLPAGGRRLVQRARGYRHTFVAGVETLVNDDLTGALPGRVLRGTR